MKFSIGDLK